MILLYRLLHYILVAISMVELMVVTAFLYVISFLPQSLSKPVFKKFFQTWCRSYVRALGVDLRLHQKNTRPLPEQYILIANHPSIFEDIGIPSLFPVNSLAKEELRYWPIVGRISYAAGTLYVKRESRQSRAEAMNQIISEVKKGHNIALYPEGGCKGKHLFSHFRYGAFKASITTGIPIVPVFIHYESQDDFFWAPGISPLTKMWQILKTKNNRANYYLYDAFDPKDFADSKTYTAQVYEQYLQWQKKYLE